MEKISGAIAFFLKFNNEMPTAGDIATIIERGGKPPFDRSVYIAVQKKHAEERTKDEWQYIRDYEKFILTGEMS